MLFDHGTAQEVRTIATSWLQPCIAHETQTSKVPPWHISSSGTCIGNLKFPQVFVQIDIRSRALP